MTEPARSFQHYEVLRRTDGAAWELGRGAMGITYKAFDVNLCCEVALKVVSTALVENPEARERFVREARAAAALRHRNVASVYHLGNDGEHFFYAMEFINGETLESLVRREGPLSVENTLRVVLQVSRALAAAERQNLVHRDIKPSNLMVTHEDADEETVVKVIDFGLARPSATGPDAPPLTISGFVGTPQYASPEQLEERPLDARSDIYSLGVTAWFLLTGRVPFTGSLASICQQQLSHPPPWDQLPASVPTCVRGLLGHMLAKDLARRPQNAAELRAEIEACLDKIQATTGRGRDLHLPALPASATAPEESRPKTTSRAVQSGTRLNGRYRLLREESVNTGVLIFQARDEAENDRSVTVRVLPEALTGTPDLRDDMAEEVRLVQAAAHPNLVQVYALERSQTPAVTFLVEEFLAGFSLRDLLAGRGGSLPATEALQVLEPAASATDHAASCRLKALDLSLTELRVSFPSLATAADDGSRVRVILPKPTVEWPEWTLKIPALCIHHDPTVLDTWAGGATLVPAAGRAAAPSASDGGKRVQALAKLFYELLGGTRETGYASLASLNEEANTILRQAMVGESIYIDGSQLYEALAEAILQEPARWNARPLAILPASQATADVADAFAGADEGPELTHASTFHPLRHESVANFFESGHDPAADDTEGLPSSSAWDRLTLVTEKRAHPGRWAVSIIALAAVFVLVFIGVLAWLLQQPVNHTPAAQAARKRPGQPTVAKTNRVPPKQNTPAPLIASASASVATLHVSASPPPTPVPTVASQRVSTPAEPALPPVESTPPAPTPVVAVAQTENVPPAPSPTETPGPRAASTPSRERSAMVHLDSVPQGAQIRLGNEVLGTTPFKIRLPRGEHQLIARYRDWPETRQTIRLEGNEPWTAVEIRIMRPDLIPGFAGQPASLSPEGRTRRIAAPSARHTPNNEPSTPPARVAPAVPLAPTPTPNEPEVRRAQRVLTPFRIDEQPANQPSEPQTVPRENRQPFTPDDDAD